MLVGLVLLSARSARADDPAASLEVTRSADAADCPDASALAALVARERGLDSLVTTAGAGATLGLEVAFARSSSGYVATVRSTGDRTGTRTIADQGPSCSALAVAVVVTLTVMLDESAPAAAPPTTPAAVAPIEPPEPPPARRATEWYGWQTLGPLDFEVAAKAGAGTNWTVASPSPMGFGIGGRAGVSILGVYAGVSGMYYVGSSTQGVFSAHSYQYGAEVGYGLKLPFLTVRAQVGLGDYGLVVETHNLMGFPPSGPIASTTSTTNNYLYLEPALVGFLSIGTWFVGADVGALLLPNGPAPIPSLFCPSGSCTTPSNKFDAGFVAHGQVGVRF